ncbi:hypothetical protein [Hanstruepera ponticola]|uniref:hypothetical protein n=1 Tax=Hanstruepera ponticola TaxID=2042995 RepID=UPI000CF0B10E|nr:hypothetical protein [Hanstruepera ponticola]
MIRKLKIICLLLLLPIYLVAQEPSTNSSNQNDLLTGKWKVDLRPAPNSDEYYQPFLVKSINNNTFTGTFYGSDIKNALINENWSKLYFAFSTSDQSNDYYHSGYLENGKLYGITYCPNREFTAPWTATRD